MIRVEKREGKKSLEGKTVLGYGIRLGYWPCMKAPFIEASLGKNRYAVWLVR